MARILALAPFHGGSHKAFLDGWVRHSRHEWTIVGLPPKHWKWRMHHAAVTLLERRRAEHADSDADLVMTTDMLDVAACRGLAVADPAARRLASVPWLTYFHENQLTYPVQEDEPRDLHFGLTNMRSALASDAVWFNSAFHRDDFLNALGDTLKRLPRAAMGGPVRAIRKRSDVQHPGIDDMQSVEASPKPSNGPLHIAWAARWEFDKNPEGFFEAIDRLEASGVDFRLTVLGESKGETPLVFQHARERFGHRIVHWGFVPSKTGYQQALAEADVFVSTAIHEFFGISAVEAMAAGLWPLLPRRLAYPELLGPLDTSADSHLYQETPVSLAARLGELAVLKNANPRQWRTTVHRVRHVAQRFEWTKRAEQMDDAVDKLLK